MAVLLLPMLSLALAPQFVAVTESGQRIPCQADTAIGALEINSTFGHYQCPQDPVVAIDNYEREVTTLQRIQAIDFDAWVSRCSSRGLLQVLTSALNNPNSKLTADNRVMLYRTIESWGKKIDPLPRKLTLEKRLDYAWEKLQSCSLSEGALISGQLLEQIQGPTATPKLRISLADLRRGLRNKNLSQQLAASSLASYQAEKDMFAPIAKTTIEGKQEELRMMCATSLLELNENGALNYWTLELLRGKKNQDRLRAIEHLASSKLDAAIDPLMVAVASSQRAPGRFMFSGRQISLVTDFDVEVAGAAAIANPQTNVLMEGTVLEVRIIATTVSRSAIWGLRKLTGEYPGDTEEDWLNWYRERKMGL